LEQAEVDHSPARAKRLEESRLRTADKLRVEQITAALNAHPGCDIDSCRALLQALPVGILPHLVSALGDLAHFPPRRLACNILAERGADRVDAIGNGIFDKRWYVIRNVALVLGNIGGPRSATYLEKVVSHPDERVRREVIEALIRMEPEHSNALLRRALDDPRFELRVLALQALARRRDAATAEAALERIRGSAFRRLEPTEQKEWLGALARIQGDDALPTFKKLLGGFALFDRSAKQRLEGLAVLALGEAESPGVVAYLEELSRGKNERIRDSAYRALNHIHNESSGA
jgi:HEAT repeat protein